jgi:hypothetical protein
VRGPPNPEMRNRPAGHGTAFHKTDFNKPKDITETTADIQARRLSRPYALSLNTASTIAALAYGVAR